MKEAGVVVVEVSVWNKDGLGPIPTSTNGNVFYCGQVEYDTYHSGRDGPSWKYLAEMEPDVAINETTVLVVQDNDGIIYRARAYDPAHVRFICVMDDVVESPYYLLTDGNLVRFPSVEEAIKSRERRRRNQKHKATKAAELRRANRKHVL